MYGSGLKEMAGPPIVTRSASRGEKCRAVPLEFAWLPRVEVYVQPQIHSMHVCGRGGKWTGK